MFILLGSQCFSQLCINFYKPIVVLHTHQIINMIIKITPIATVGMFLIIFAIKSEAFETKTYHFTTGNKARQQPERNNQYIWPNEEKFIKTLGNFFNHTTQYSTSAKKLNQVHEDSVIYTTEEITKEHTNIEMNIGRSLASSWLIHRDRSLLKTLSHSSHVTNASKKLEFQKNNQQPLHIQNKPNSTLQKLLHFKMLTDLLSKPPRGQIPDTYLSFLQRDHQEKEIDSDASSTKLGLAVINENANADKTQNNLNKYNVRIGIKFYVNGENCEYSNVQDGSRNKDDNSQCTDYIIIPEINQNGNLERVINNSMFMLMPTEASQFKDNQFNEKQNLFGEEPHKVFQDDHNTLLLEQIQKISLNSHAKAEDLSSSINGLDQTLQKVSSNEGNQNNLALYEYPSIYLQPPLYSGNSREQIFPFEPHTYDLHEAYHASDHKSDIHNRDNNKLPLLSLHNLTEIQKPKYTITGVSEQGIIKFPSFNSQVGRIKPNPMYSEITHGITPSTYKRGYSRNQLLNSRYHTNRDDLIDNFPSGSILSNRQKVFASTENKNNNFVSHSPQITHTKFNNFPHIHTFSPFWSRSQHIRRNRFFDHSQSNTYPTLSKNPYSNQRLSQTQFALSFSLTPPSTFDRPLYYSNNIETKEHFGNPITQPFPTHSPQNIFNTHHKHIVVSKFKNADTQY